MSNCENRIIHHIYGLTILFKTRCTIRQQSLYTIKVTYSLYITEIYEQKVTPVLLFILTIIQLDNHVPAAQGIK